MVPDPTQDNCIACVDDPLPVADIAAWAVTPRCGAVVTFTGTVRDHADGRTDVVSVEYEAYREHVEIKLAAVADAARHRWPAIGRLALVHRVGRLAVGEASVTIVVSTPHRSEAFDAARFCIDTVKQTVPIWKREQWSGGDDWGLCAQPLVDARELPTR